MYRPRRLRQYEAWRALIRETRLSADQLVMPLFVRPGKNIRAAIPSMPGQFQLSVDQLVKECQQLVEQQVPAILLFGLVERKDKDEKASEASAKDGIIQQAVAAIKTQARELLVITDVCLCAYMSHGHCGVVKSVRSSEFGVRRERRRHYDEQRTPNHEPNFNSGSITMLPWSCSQRRRCPMRRPARTWWRRPI